MHAALHPRNRAVAQDPRRPRASLGSGCWRSALRRGRTWFGVPGSAYRGCGYAAAVSEKQPRDDAPNESWGSERGEHWHGAEPTAETASRDEEASESVEAEKSERAHEGRVSRWEEATGRTWNRNHGTGGQ